jgi:hypothetical protein
MKEDVYKELKEYFMNDDEVVVNSGKGAQGIKHNKKMFIMFHKGNLLIKMSPDRIQELIGSGNGQAFDPGTGKVMKDRILIPRSQKDLWISFCEESKRYILQS